MSSKNWHAVVLSAYLFFGFFFFIQTAEQLIIHVEKVVVFIWVESGVARVLEEGCKFSFGDVDFILLIHVVRVLAP